MRRCTRCKGTGVEPPQASLEFEPHKLHRKHDPITSWDAADSASEVRREHHRHILTAIRNIGRPATSEEIAAAARLTHWQTTRRMGELRDSGLVGTDGYALNRSGRRAIRWYLVLETPGTP